eukprot:1159452-Pelagomonas_calceolata.AAC.6
MRDASPFSIPSRVHFSREGISLTVMYPWLCQNKIKKWVEKGERPGACAFTFKAAVLPHCALPRAGNATLCVPSDVASTASSRTCLEAAALSAAHCLLLVARPSVHTDPSHMDALIGRARHLSRTRSHTRPGAAALCAEQPLGTACQQHAAAAAWHKQPAGYAGPSGVEQAASLVEVICAGQAAAAAAATSEASGPGRGPAGGRLLGVSAASRYGFVQLSLSNAAR